MVAVSLTYKTRDGARSSCLPYGCTHCLRHLEAGPESKAQRAARAFVKECWPIGKLGRSLSTVGLLRHTC